MLRDLPITSPVCQLSCASLNRPQGPEQQGSAGPPFSALLLSLLPLAGGNLTEGVAGCYRGSLQPLCQCQQLLPVSQCWQRECLSLVWVGSTVLRLMARCGFSWCPGHVTLVHKAAEGLCVDTALLFREDEGFDQTRAT